MIRRLILSAAVLAAGLALTPASADAHPTAVVPVYRPVYDPPHHHRRHHHSALFGVRVYVPATPVVVARPVYTVPAPVVVVPAPTCPPAPVVYPTPYRR